MSEQSPNGDDFSIVDEDQKEVLDDEPRSIIRGIISQLTKGTDLHRVTLPTFVLEPRSMLERITDFMCHPDLIMATSRKTDPVDRFLDVVRYYVSGWHIRPRGVKKPYNSVLGEVFRCQYRYADGTTGYYVAEQTSHHPPVSTYFFSSPENHLLVEGEVKPKSKFLGNSAATLMTGETRICFTNLDEVYTLNLPNVYARGLLFGTMVLELGDSIVIKCPKTDLVCEMEFKVKGYFSGTYNAISGKIKRMSKKETLYELSGKWSDVSFIKPAKGYADPTEFFNAHEENIHPKIVAPEADQEPYESRRLWSKVTAAIQARDLDTATEEKTKIEDAQRAQRIDRERRGEAWEPRFFQQVGDDPEEFEFRLIDSLADDPQKRRAQLEDFIFNNPPPSRI
ncbi:hypothetical protein GGF32_007955 [Allomyces javanicus]|nr:hypothetical protein GGF32_007955 [Allomyces javanicus]